MSINRAAIERQTGIETAMAFGVLLEEIRQLNIKLDSLLKGSLSTSSVSSDSIARASVFPTASVKAPSFFIFDGGVGVGDVLGVSLKNPSNVAVWKSIVEAD